MLAARGYFHYWGQLDYERADLAFDPALEQSPNFLEAIAGKTFVARRDGRFEEALTLLEMGRRLDPLNVDFHSSITETLVGLGRFDEAIEALARARASDRDLAVDPTITGLVWEGQGDAEQAWHAVADAEGVNYTNLYQYRTYYALRTRDPANIRQARLVALVPRPRLNLARFHGVFAIDIETCPQCGGRLRVIACIGDPPLISKILGHVQRRETLTSRFPRAPPDSQPALNLT